MKSNVEKATQSILDELERLGYFLPDRELRILETHLLHVLAGVEDTAFDFGYEHGAVDAESVFQHHDPCPCDGCKE